MALTQPTLADVDLLDHDLFAEREPWDVFELLQREAPVYHHPEPDGPGFWAVTKYDDVLAVLKDWETYSSERGGSATIETLPEDVLAARRNFMETDPPRHTQFRRIFAADFTPRAVRRYDPWLHELVLEVAEPALAKGEFEAVHDVAAPIPIRVLARILGLSDEHLPRLVELGDKMLVDTEPEYVGERAFEGERPEDRFLPFGSPWAEELCALGREYYGDRRAHPRDDALSLIANAELDGCPLSESDLDNTFAILVVAGNETTRQAIASGLLAFARNPDQWALLRSEPELLPRAVEEVLRYRAPGLALPPHRHARHGAARPADHGRRQGRRLVRGSEPRPGRLPRPAPLRHHPRAERARDVRQGRPALLPRRAPRPARADRAARRARPAGRDDRARGRAEAPALELHERPEVLAAARGPGGLGPGPRPPDRLYDRAVKAAVLAGLLVLALAACGGSESGSGGAPCTKEAIQEALQAGSDTTVEVDAFACEDGWASGAYTVGPGTEEGYDAAFLLKDENGTWTVPDPLPCDDSSIPTKILDTSNCKVS